MKPEEEAKLRAELAQAQQRAAQLEESEKKAYQVLASRNGDLAELRNACRMMLYAARRMVRALPATMTAEQRTAYQEATEVIDRFKKLGVDL